MPSARAAKLSAMRWRRIAGASATTSSTEGAKRPSIKARARAASIRAWLARGPGPQATCWRTVSISLLSGRPERTSFKDRLDHAVADRHAAHQALRQEKIARIHDRVGLVFLRTGGGKQHLTLRRLLGIGDVDLHQEAIELRFGQRIGALLLDRVLGRQHMKGLGQGMGMSADGDAVLLHCLQ